MITSHEITKEKATGFAKLVPSCRLHPPPKKKQRLINLRDTVTIKIKLTVRKHRIFESRFETSDLLCNWNFREITLQKKLFSSRFFPLLRLKTIVNLPSANKTGSLQETPEDTKKSSSFETVIFQKSLSSYATDWYSLFRT